MPTGIKIIDRIVIAIAIQVQAVDGFEIQVGGIVGANKSAPLGGVIPGVAIVQASIVIVVVTTVANEIGFAYILPPSPPGVKKKPRDYFLRKTVDIRWKFACSWNSLPVLPQCSTHTKYPAGQTTVAE